MKNKEIYLAVAAVAATILVYGLYKRSKNKPDLVAAAVAPVVDVVAPYTIQVINDPNNGVYLVLNGEKFGFMSEKAFTAYGYTAPKMVAKEVADAIPSKGFINDDGKLVRS